MKAVSNQPLDPRNPEPAPGQGRPPVLPALTSVRFFAALAVALYHFLPQDSFLVNQRPSGALSGFFGSGYVGVSFFFVLSGFILTYAHVPEFERGEASLRRFFFARFARIYPAYLLSLVAAVLVFPGTFRALRHLVVLVADLLMLQAWSVRTILFLNIPSWTLSCEAFFYALFPLLLLRFRPSSRRAALLWMGACWLVAIVLPAALLFAQFGLRWTLWLPEQPRALAFVMNPLAAFPQFLAGIALGWTHLLFPISRRNGFRLATLGCAAVLLAMLFAQHLPDTLLRNGLLLPVFAAVILGLATDNHLSRALSARPLILLGEASYAFYLLHYVFNRWLVDRWHVGDSFVDALWKLAILIPVSIAVYLGFEWPARRWLLRWWNARFAYLPNPPAVQHPKEHRST